MAPKLALRTVAAVCALIVAAPASAARAPANDDYASQAFNVLPPGEYGALPLTPNSTDQLLLYDGLTPLGGNVGARDVTRYFKPERFGDPRMQGRREATGRRGLTLIRDSYDVPHIFGKRRADVLFGAGWVTAEDRGLFIQLIRGPARLTALDAPGFDPLSLATSGRQFVSSARTEVRLRRERTAFLRRGARGRQALADVDAYVAGINAYIRAKQVAVAPWTSNDVLAAASLIGAVFGRGGGDEVRSAQLLAALQQRLGTARGLSVWRDLRSGLDPETPVTTTRRFPYETPVTSGATPGSAIVDAGSLSAAAARNAAAAGSAARPMSNSLLIGAARSRTGHPLAVMGPQVGYFYPQFLMELDMHGGGIDARGAAFPGVSLYVLLGRGKDYAWSATSSGSDNIDQYVEELCNTDGSPPTRASTAYVRDGRCTPMTTFDAGKLTGGGRPDEQVVLTRTVHGPVTGTVTVGGRPYAVTSRRSTRGRDGLSALAFMDLNDNAVRSAKDFVRVMNQVEFTFNWSYVDDRDIAFFSSGRLPLRAPGTDPSLPTLGTGKYEWRGWLPGAAHPQAINPRGGLLLSWNNKPATAFGASDSKWSYGPVHRVDLFTGFTSRMTLPGLVGVMNRAATQDLRALRVWPEIRAVLGAAAPDARTAQAAQLIDDWRAAGASRIDRDLDGKMDAPGAAVLDQAWRKLADAALEPVVGPQLSDLARVVTRDNAPGPVGSAYNDGWYGYLNKDLRTLLGKRVKGKYANSYCGAGDRAACQSALWAALKQAADELAAAQGADPAAWRSDATKERIQFAPGLLGPLTMRWTNRPTFQQVIEFDGHRPR